jgi:hypothetical protein
MQACGSTAGLHSKFFSMIPAGFTSDHHQKDIAAFTGLHTILLHDHSDLWLPEVAELSVGCQYKRL